MSNLEAFLGQGVPAPERQGNIVSFVSAVTAIFLGIGLLIGGFFLKGYEEQDAHIYSSSTTATVLDGARSDGYNACDGKTPDCTSTAVCTLSYSFVTSSGQHVNAETAEPGSCTKLQDEGAERTVYYDPKAPQISTLRNPLDSQTGSWIYLAGTGLVVGVAGLVAFLVLRLRRPATEREI